MLPLDAADLAHFLERGFVRVPAAFDGSWVAAWRRDACARLSCDEDDPRTWPQGIHHAGATLYVPFARIAPKAWEAACQLVGGHARIAMPCEWSDGFIINFPTTSPPDPWHHWHKDGDWFRHFLDSPEQGLLVLPLLSHLEPGGGGTLLACDSVGPIARDLAEHPQGMEPEAFSCDEIVKRCSDIEEVTGEVGDVLLIHPFMLHSRSLNRGNTPRFMINPPIKLAAPMRFDGPCPSPVERAILRALDVPSYRFAPTRPRHQFQPSWRSLPAPAWEEQARARGRAWADATLKPESTPEEGPPRQ